jgi:hypothetical protein
MSGGDKLSRKRKKACDSTSDDDDDDDDDNNNNNNNPNVKYWVLICSKMSWITEHPDYQSSCYQGITAVPESHLFAPELSLSDR